MKKVKFYTLGCKVNTYESEAMKESLKNAGYEITSDKNADIFIVNTCTVTAVSDKKSRQILHRIKRKNPSSLIIAAGCYSQVSEKDILNNTDADILIGNSKKSDIVNIIKNYNGIKTSYVTDMPTEYEEFSSSTQSRTRAVLKIQDGCENFCSYCIIPYARGPIRSRSVESAVNEAKALSEQGFSEIVLTGIEVASYGYGTDFSILDIIEKISEIEKIKRIRLSSLEPTLFTKEFVDKISKFEKLCPSFHISLQSGCSETLNRMNRKYNAEIYLENIEYLKKSIPDCSITTDIMVGFPGETDEEFEKSVETVKKSEFSGMHVFQYSKRPGTPAATMPNQIPETIKADRSAKMIKIGKESKKNYYSKFLNKEVEVLFEQECELGFEGHTANYIRVITKGKNLENKYKKVIIKKIFDDYCEGIIIN